MAPAWAEHCNGNSAASLRVPYVAASVQLQLGMVMLCARLLSLFFMLCACIAVDARVCRVETSRHGVARHAAAVDGRVGIVLWLLACAVVWG